MIGFPQRATAGIAWRRAGDGLEISVRLTPRAGCDRIDGLVAAGQGEPLLGARVRAAPEKGRANAALEALLADVLKLPKSAVQVSAGARSRIKTVRAIGEPALVEARLSALVAGKRD